MKRLLFTLGILFALVPAVGIAQQVLTLTTPINPPSQTTCILKSVLIEPDVNGNGANARIVVNLQGTNGEAVASKIYSSATNPTAASLLSQLNTANLTGNSLISRIYQRLSTDGVCVGSVTGTPQ